MNILRKVYVRVRAQRILSRMGIERPPVRAQEVAEAMSYELERMFLADRAHIMRPLVGIAA